MPDKEVPFALTSDLVYPAISVLGEVLAMPSKRPNLDILSMMPKDDVADMEQIIDVMTTRESLGGKIGKC